MNCSRFARIIIMRFIHHHTIVIRDEHAITVVQFQRASKYDLRCAVSVDI